MASFVSELERAAGEPARYGDEEGYDAAFDTLVAYIELTPGDQARLSAFAPRARRHFDEIVAHFYDKVMSCPQTAAVLTGGQAQVDRLRQTMLQWLETGLSGPHDDAFLERRRRTGEVHVRIGLPQHLMVAAMSVIRIDLHRVVDRELHEPAQERTALIESIDRWLDLELGIMIEAYRAASHERMRRKARLAIVGQLAATIAHDLRNPMSVLDSSLHILRRHAGADAKTARHVERMSQQLRQCHTIISDLLEVARESPPRAESIDITALAAEALAATSAPEGVRTELDVEQGLRFVGDKGLLRQALVNLLVNAHIAVGERGGGVVLIVARSEGEEVLIEVLDDGPGFAPDVLPMVFEPLVTTRAKGTGLGLALVESVARRHGGRVSASNRAEGGACVRLRLPRGGPATAA